MIVPPHNSNAVIAEPFFQFPGFHGKWSICYLIIGCTTWGVVVVAIERFDNPAASITNAAENLWEHVAKELGSNEFTAVEVYADKQIRYDRVDRRRHEELGGGPLAVDDVFWRPLTDGAARELLGAPVIAHVEIACDQLRQLHYAGRITP